MTVAFQVASVSVLDATYLGMEFIRSTNGSDAIFEEFVGLGGLGQAQGRLQVHAQLSRFGQIGEGLEAWIVGFHAQAREMAARCLGAGGEVDIAAAHDRDQQAARAQQDRA